MDLQGKKVTVVGLGKSGIAACNLLIEKGAKVSITDSSDNEKTRESARKLKKKHNIVVEIGKHSEDLITHQDLVVVSPGVAADAAPIYWAKKKGIPLIGEVELAFNFCPAPIIAITGTNGKTTVTTLVGEIFKACGQKCVVCGNIGNPFTAEIARISKNHIVVLEISSFQLETIEKFRPKVAVILNLTTDHLDRYQDFNEYVKAKCRIFSNQTEEDSVILNDEDPNCLALAAMTKAKVLFFSKIEVPALGNNFNANHHAALTVSSLFGLPQDITLNTLQHFPGIEHRLEEVRELKGIKFINDSKATNVDSTLWALNSINRPVVLIAGGTDKGSDFVVIKEAIENKVKALVLFGEAREKIEQVLGATVATKVTANVEQAVEEAFRLARQGDCVLLSPMCASFDQFSDYKERGKAFKEVVRALV